MKKNLYNVIMVDNDNNFYGVWKVETVFTENAIHLIIKNIILDMFKTKDKFFEDFEVNLCKVYTKLTERNGIFNVDLEYFGSDTFNVDKIFE